MICKFINQSIGFIAFGAILVGCQTIQSVPEQTRLSLLQANPTDYSRFPKREAADKQEGRGLRGSLNLAEAVGENSLIEDVKIEEDLGRLLTGILPKDYQYKVNDEIKGEYPLDTQFYIYNLDSYDAEALPNGDILFSDELLYTTSYADTLEWIIAHEASHQLLDHHRSRENREARNQAISILGTVALLATGNGRAANLALGATTGALVLNQAGVSQFEAKEEIEADQLAMDLILQKDDPRNPNKALERLQQWRDASAGLINEVEKEIDEVERQYIAYCGEAGLFASLTQAQNPNAQTRVCQQWYIVGRAGIEQSPKYQLPLLKKDLETNEQRYAAAQEYFDMHIAALPGELPPIVAFTDGNSDQRTNYVRSVSINGPLQRSYLTRQVYSYLDQNRCSEAVTTARGILRSNSDEDPIVRKAAFRAEKACPTEAKPYSTNRVCKPSAGHFGPYEHLCVSYEADRADGEMLRELQSEFKARTHYDDALEVLRKRVNINEQLRLPLLLDEIELLRLVGRSDEMTEKYEECQALETSAVGADFKALCKEKAFPEQFEDTESGSSNGSVGAPNALPPLINNELVSFDALVSFDIFETALLNTEINELVRGEGEYVIYMPTDGALRRYVKGEDPAVLLEPRNRKLLRKLISAHVVRRDVNGKHHFNSPHLTVGFAFEDDVEHRFLEAGGVIHGSATYGAYTLKPIDKVIAP